MRNLWNKLVLIISVLVISITNSKACDFCSVFNYGNVANNTFVRFEYRRSLFKNYNQEIAYTTLSEDVSNSDLTHRALPGSDVLYLNHPDDYEFYSGMFLNFNFNINPRWNLSAGLPYRINIDNYGLVIRTGEESSAEQEVFTGLGDFWLGAERIFTLSDNDFKQHLLKIGLQVDFPVGKYEVDNVFQDNVHMQPGRTVYALNFSANYNFESEGFWGVNSNLTFYRPLNLNNYLSTYSYAYASELVGDVSAYKIFNGELKKVFSLGTSVIATSTEAVNEFEIENTGGVVLSGIVGVGLAYKQFFFQTDLSIPFFQRLNSLQLKQQYNFGVSISYFFDFKKKDKE